MEKCLSVKHRRLRSCTNVLALIHLSPRPADAVKLHNVCEAWNSSVTAQTRQEQPPHLFWYELVPSGEAGEEAAPLLKAAVGRVFLSDVQREPGESLHSELTGQHEQH